MSPIHASRCQRETVMITKATMSFLRDLKTHNTRDWFDMNRNRYHAARTEFISVVDAVIAGISHFEPHVLELEPEDCIFRINRDTRFSKDKTPYKPNLGAFITHRGRKVARAGYYVHLEPGECVIAGGLYMPPAPEIKAIREAIVDDGTTLRRIIGKAQFKTAFGKELPGVRVKTAPRGVPKDHPDLDLLRLQSYEIYHDVSDKEVLSPDFINAAVRYFVMMQDYVAWLNLALDRKAGR